MPQTRSDWDSRNMAFRDDVYSMRMGESALDSAFQLAGMNPYVAHTMMEEWYDYTNADRWTLTAVGAGSAAVGDAAGGILSLVTAAADNDDAAIHTTNECWLFVANEPLWLQAKINLTEANVNDSNWFVGLTDNVAADFMQDNGGGPAANWDGCGFFKVDGTMNIQFESSNAAVQVTTAAVAPFTSGVWYTLGFKVWTVLAADTVAVITPYVFNHTTGVYYPLPATPVAHNITLAGLAEMHAAFIAKAGDTNVETLLCDYMKIVQVR